MKENHFCWASFCSNWCSAISIDLQPALPWQKISPFICVYACQQLYAGSLPAFLWFHGGQRELVHVIWSGDFCVLTFSSTSPLAPTSAFSHFAASSPSFSHLLCLLMLLLPSKPTAFSHAAALTGVQHSNYCLQLVN